MAVDNKASRRKILGYSNKLTVRPGDSIEFKVSSENNAPYTAQLIRLINGVKSSDETEYKEIEIDSSVNGRYIGRHQPIYSGSCIVFEETQVFDTLDEFTLTFFFMATTPAIGKQDLFSRWDDARQTGWSVYLNKSGQLAFVTSQCKGENRNVAIRLQPCKPKAWYQVKLRVSWIVQTVQLECTEVCTTPHEVSDDLGVVTGENIGSLPDPKCPLLMAASFGGWDISKRPIPVSCFNGRIEAPAIYRGILTDSELYAVANGVRPTNLADRLVADWDFSEGIDSTHIKDCSVNKVHGYTHNLPLRAVKGVHWDGSSANWQELPEHYGAIHFHDDDLYNCGWKTDILYQLPDDLDSGVYAIRLRLDVSDNFAEGSEEYIPFFVAALKDKPQAKLAFLVPTFTYLAYANKHGLGEELVALLEKYASGIITPTKDSANSIDVLSGAEYVSLINAHPDVGLSAYDRHSDGSPVHFSSWLRPMLNIKPKSVIWTLCADLLFVDWLEEKNISYDIITDDLLHKEGASLLSTYDVVMTGNHPEYVTTEQLDAINAYTNRGGRFMYMGGNGFYWRVAVSCNLDGVIEVRRGRVGTATWYSDVGEAYLSFNGEQGGLWRESGRPPQQQFGVGYIAAGFSKASYFRITPEAKTSRAKFIIEGVEGDKIGDFGILCGGAAGQEFDRTNAKYGTPSHAVVIARSECHGDNMLIAVEEMEYGIPVMEMYQDQIYAEVVFFETLNGGAVFTVSSMAWCGSFCHNDYINNVSTITENVINRFLDPTPFLLPETCGRQTV